MPFRLDGFRFRYLAHAVQKALLLAGMLLQKSDEGSRSDCHRQTKQQEIYPPSQYHLTSARGPFAFRFGAIVLRYCVSTSAKLHGCAPTTSDTSATLQYERNRLSGGKRAFYQVDGVEQQFCLERLANVSGLSKSVLFPLENQQAGCDAAAFERGEHRLRLIDRHDWIVLAVEEYDWRRKILHEVDRERS